MSIHLSKDIRVPIGLDNPSIVRDESKCIRCSQCKLVCSQFIGVHDTYRLEDTADRAVCINCGQCANVCPPASITEKYEYKDVAKATQNPSKIVIFSTSPSVRAALGEEFGLADGSFVQGKMVSLLRILGGDYVLDTNFAADMTIVEEASELIERITKGNKPLPQFTSCCPAWVKYVETYFPEMRENLSTAKSPIGMQGPTIKTYFAKKMGLDPTSIVNVAITPCTAKKFEIRREEMKAAGEYLEIENLRDMDYVITTRELAMWAKEEGIDFLSLPDSNYDGLMGEGSGAGVIFGNTGGVMEAAVRTAYKFLTGETAPEQLFDFKSVRGLQDVKEASVKIGDLTLNLAVIYGTKRAGEVIQQLKSGEKDYHFLEVMTCPGGCIGGGGQPRSTLDNADKIRQKRIESLYVRDESMTGRVSEENKELIMMYQEFYKNPLSEIAKKMLHTSYTDRKGDLGMRKANKKWRCSVCGYVYDETVGEGDIKEGTTFEELPDDWVCPICGASKSAFVEEGAMQEKKSMPTPIYPIMDDKLSFGAMYALCTNLARGCEKQYRVEESALWTQLAQYYSSVARDFDGDIDSLTELAQYDAESVYPLIKDLAQQKRDRGALRALVWSEKVTAILLSLYARYKKEGDSLLKDTKIYVCEICGYVHIGNDPPEICPICKVPKLKIHEIRG